MGVRSWFGLNDQFYLEDEINHCLDELLNQYRQALHNYFGIEQTDNIKQFQDEVNAKSWKNHEMTFIKWLFDDGIKAFEILNNKISNDPQLISSIRYQIYILEPEVANEYPDDLRDCLISIPDSISEYFNSYGEISVGNEVEDINLKVKKKLIQELVSMAASNKEYLYMHIKNVNATNIEISFNKKYQYQHEGSRIKQDYIKRVCQQNYGEKYLGSAYQKAEPFFWREIGIYEYGSNLQTV
ncbi:hypothetical protein [Bacillus safensis]|uniref:hypothetical protein n=1 Tax=Bacillus safensis TaxID=561879 RepID=UPI002E29B61B|nr:hypothetical protein [Bacillus safensis]MED5223227.1 hypothetical protein [Bacillus safensis]